MGNQETRQEIATAASTVAGVNCTSNYRQSLKPGDAFVRLAGRRRDGSALGYTDTWQVWLALPQDLVKAEKWLDDHIEDVSAALCPVINPNTVLPAELALGANTVPGVIFEGIRESSC